MKPFALRLALACATLAAAACAAPRAGEVTVGATTADQDIVGGQLTAGFPAVGLLFNVTSAQQLSGAVCTATVIAPHTLLTAAHCVLMPSATGGELPQLAPASRLFFYPQNDATRIDRSQLVAASSVQVPSSLDLQRFVTTVAAGKFNTDDIAVVTTATPLAAAPQAFYPQALTQGDVGDAVTLVGYGSTGSATYTGPRQKRAVQAQIGGVNDALIGTSNAGHGVCTGDSGGPMLLQSGIVGITQGGQIDPKTHACSGGDVFTRVDDWSDFLNAALAQDGAGATASR